MLKKLFIAVALFAAVACGSQNGTKTTQKPDKNFYIYLAFGQSNMEGPYEGQHLNEHLSQLMHRIWCK